MKIVCCALLLIVCSSTSAQTPDSTGPRLIIRPMVGFVPAVHHSGSVTIDGAYDHQTALVYEKGGIALGGQIEVKVIAPLFVALGGQTSLHEVTTVARPYALANKVNQNRQLVHLWAALGIRTEYFSILAGPLKVREMGTSDHFLYNGYGETRRTCQDDGTRTYSGWTGGAMMEIPIKNGARFSAAVQRHSVSWSDAIGYATSRFYGLTELSSCQLRPWSSVTSSNPPILNFQAGLAIPVF